MLFQLKFEIFSYKDLLHITFTKPYIFSPQLIKKSRNSMDFYFLFAEKNKANVNAKEAPPPSPTKVGNATNKVPYTIYITTYTEVRSGTSWIPLYKRCIKT